MCLFHFHVSQCRHSYTKCSHQPRVHYPWTKDTAHWPPPSHTEVAQLTTVKTLPHGPGNHTTRHHCVDLVPFRIIDGETIAPILTDKAVTFTTCSITFTRCATSPATSICTSARKGRGSSCARFVVTTIVAAEDFLSTKLFYSTRLEPDTAHHHEAKRSFALSLAMRTIIEFYFHSVKEISTVAKSHQMEITGALEDAKEVVTKLTGAIEGNNRMIEQVEISKRTAFLAINQAFEILQQTLEERKRTLLSELEAISLSKTTALTLQKEQFEKMVGDIGHYINMMILSDNYPNWVKLLYSSFSIFKHMVSTSVARVGTRYHVKLLITMDGQHVQNSPNDLDKLTSSGKFLHKLGQQGSGQGQLNSGIAIDVKVTALSGTNGSQLWDSAFAAQAFLEGTNGSQLWDSAFAAQAFLEVRTKQGTQKGSLQCWHCPHYVTMRLLSVARGGPSQDTAAPSRRCVCIPSWGKFWLAVLNVYHWNGVHCLFPELCSKETFAARQAWMAPLGLIAGVATIGVLHFQQLSKVRTSKKACAANAESHNCVPMSALLHQVLYVSCPWTKDTAHWHLLKWPSSHSENMTPWAWEPHHRHHCVDLVPFRIIDGETIAPILTDKAVTFTTCSITFTRCATSPATSIRKGRGR
eukprot:Em0029g33a